MTQLHLWSFLFHFVQTFTISSGKGLVSVGQSEVTSKLLYFGFKTPFSNKNDLCPHKRLCGNMPARHWNCYILPKLSLLSNFYKQLYNFFKWRINFTTAGLGLGLGKATGSATFVINYLCCFLPEGGHVIGDWWISQHYIVTKKTRSASGCVSNSSFANILVSARLGLSSVL